jgi:hypothetical protein
MKLTLLLLEEQIMDSRGNRFGFDVFFSSVRMVMRQTVQNVIIIGPRGNGYPVTILRL